MRLEYMIFNRKMVTETEKKGKIGTENDNYEKKKKIEKFVTSEVLKQRSHGSIA